MCIMCMHIFLCICQADHYNSAGRSEDAKMCGNMSLFCNLCSLIYFALLVIGVIAMVIVVVVVGLDLVAGAFEIKCYVNQNNADISCW